MTGGYPAYRFSVLFAVNVNLSPNFFPTPYPCVLALILFVIIVMQNIEIVAVIICLSFAGLHKKP